MEIPSDSGITFNVQPKMKALEIGKKARDAILSRKFDQVTIVVVCLLEKREWNLLHMYVVQVVSYGCR